MRSIVTQSTLLLAIAFAATFANSLPSSLIIGDRIVGGENTTIDRFPFQISFRRNNRHICGGSVYKLNVVITAAHCLASAETLKELSVVSGITFTNECGLQIGVENIFVHPGYDTSPTKNDIALLILEKALHFSDKIQPIRLPKPEEAVRSGTKAVVSGWGRLTEGGESPEQLQFVSVHIITNEECAEKYGADSILPSMICAGDEGGGKDSCQGDSGGPLVVGNVLVGIVSWGRGCARPDYPGVYARVAYLRKWIDNTLTMHGL